MRPFVLVLLVGCTAPKSEQALPAGLSAEEKAAMEAALERARPRADVALTVDGIVSLFGETFDLSVPQRGADLGVALVALARTKPTGQGTIRVDVAKDTPSADLRRLMAVFGAVGLEDYRLDLGR